MSFIFVLNALTHALIFCKTPWDVLKGASKKCIIIVIIIKDTGHVLNSNNNVITHYLS